MRNVAGGLRPSGSWLAARRLNIVSDGCFCRREGYSYGFKYSQPGRARQPRRSGSCTDRLLSPTTHRDYDMQNDEQMPADVLPMVR